VYVFGVVSSLRLCHPRAQGEGVPPSQSCSRSSPPLVYFPSRAGAGSPDPRLQPRSPVPHHPPVATRLAPRHEVVLPRACVEPNHPSKNKAQRSAADESGKDAPTAGVGVDEVADGTVEHVGMSTRRGVARPPQRGWGLRRRFTGLASRRGSLSSSRYASPRSGLVRVRPAPLPSYSLFSCASNALLLCWHLLRSP
jgi:hypothetical protein